MCHSQQALLGLQGAGDVGTVKSDSEQKHQEEPALVVDSPNTWHIPVQLLFSAVFSENEGLAIVNMLLGWKDAHAQSKL